ncbi:hypothetical protein [uncultured Kordia sp.]|uniref:hypothetical protein n=1 Tax=uncultured Kordia sp. TaxID=507699 RepID=UPI0026224EB7|nr:hypothetical protein [uncultured Kordia sp.]
MEEQLHNKHIALRSIKEKMLTAREQILIGSCWCMDDEILELLIRQSKKGILIKLSIDENSWEQKVKLLDFDDNFKVSIFKNINDQGWNRDFCLIDREIAIYASTNWSFHNKNNYSGGVTISHRKDIIEKFINEFNVFFVRNISKNISSTPKRGLFGWLKGVYRRIDEEELEQEQDKESLLESSKRKADKISEGITAIDEVLDSIVITDIESFNKNELLLAGAESAQRVRGNPDTLSKIMDSLYNIFLCSINNNIKQKEDLKTKINLKVAELTNSFSKYSNGEIATKESEITAKKKQFQIELNHLDTEIEKINLSVKDLESNKIPQKEIEIKKIEEEKLKLDIEKIPRPPKKRYAIIKYLIYPIGLFVISFLFYASSAYILLYAKQDYENYRFTPNFFNSDFFQLAINRQGLAIFYILVFSVIPFSLAHYADRTKNKLSKVISYLTIISLDSLISYKVKNSIDTIRELNDGIERAINLEWCLEFFFIFFFGFVPLIMFVNAVSRLKKYIKDRLPREEEEQAKLKKKQLTDEILLLSSELFEYTEEVEELKKNKIQMIELQNEIKINISYLDVERQEGINELEIEKEEYITYIKKRADIYKNGIDNNTIYLPLAAFKDRISVFLQGWAAWLYKEFAEEKSKELYNKAYSIVDSWSNDNINLPEKNIIKVINPK